MSTTIEFPNQCMTNAFILHDFTEIAYIVCTVAHPPSNGGATLAPTPENNLARLRMTEKQFRQASILAALDAEKHELFTFYRKVDVVKDQKTILSKFGLVLRSNSCIISYKAAARVPELFKSDNSRLYRLFVSALLASIDLKSISKVVPLGPRAHLVQDEEPSAASTFWPANPQPSTWHIRKVDLQVIPSGQILLTVAKDSDAHFHLVSDLIDSVRKEPAIDTPSLVYLEPLGHLARYAGGWYGTLPVDSGPENENEDVVRRHSWAELVRPWLKMTTSASLDHEDDVWLEMEVFLLHEFTSAEDTTIRRKEMWQRVLWPAKHTYAMIMPERSAPPAEQPDLLADPVQLLEDCIKSSITKSVEAQQQRADGSDGEEGGTHLFSEDVQFDEMEQSSFHPARFSMQQTIYPTPPDAVITHATPGVYSIDGAAITPAHKTQEVSDVSVVVQDAESRPRSERNMSLPRSGFYDEDLFEDAPSDKYGRLPVGEEPNWDFFDPPDTQMHDVATDEKVQPSRLDHIHVNGEDQHLEVEYGSQGDATNQPHPVDGMEISSPVEDKSDVQRTKSSKNNKASGNYAVVSGLPPQIGGATSTQGMPDMWTFPADSVHALGAPPRRTSIYEGLTTQLGSPSLTKVKYTANGKFWFKENASRRGTETSTDIVRPKRPLSPSSTDEDTDEEDIAEIETTNNLSSSPLTIVKPHWSLYPADVPDIGAMSKKALDVAAIQTEASAIFELIKLDLPSEQLLGAIMSQLLTTPSSSHHTTKDSIPHGSNSDVDAVDDPVTVAQIFVAQVSQSIFIRDAVQMHSVVLSHRTDISVDLAGASSGTSPTTLDQLVTMKTMPPTMKARGKIAKMEQVQIEMQRNDKTLISHTSILPFWDALCLQPQDGSKNVTAFCIYPCSTNAQHGCKNMLDRIAEAYSGCNLGSHTTTNLLDIAEDGLISWNGNYDEESDLYQICEKLSSAILDEDLYGHNLVFYMISKDRSAQSYVLLCKAFLRLHETASVVLQVVPLDFVASSDTLVTPTQAEYASLAMEVYNRVPFRFGDDDEEIGTIHADHTVKLARNINKNLAFELNTIPGHPWAPNGPCLHVAYAPTADRRWIVAAWSDDSGKIAFSMSYMLRAPRTDEGRSRLDILRDIWEISQNVMTKQGNQRQRSKWRLVIARQGLYETDEAAEWQQISQSANSDRKSVCILMLLSVDLEPALSIKPQRGQLRAQFTASVGALGTPVSTPQAATTSPDQNVPATPTPGASAALNAPTPPDHSFDPSGEIDLSLTDTVEDSWVVILPFGLNQSHSILDIRPALASGFIIKTNAEQEEDGHVMLGVSLVATTQQTSTHVHHYQRDEWLEDILEQYRSLSALAWIRGCVDKAKDLVPWHIATAIKAAKYLEQAGI